MILSWKTWRERRDNNEALLFRKSEILLEVYLLKKGTELSDYAVNWLKIWFSGPPKMAEKWIVCAFLNLIRHEDNKPWVMLCSLRSTIWVSWSLFLPAAKRAEAEAYKYPNFKKVLTIKSLTLETLQSLETGNIGIIGRRLRSRKPVSAKFSAQSPFQLSTPLFGPA